MSYIDAFLDKDHDKILVAKRENGVRVFVEHPADYVFYYDSPRGQYTTIYGTPVNKFSSNNHSEFRKELAIHNNKRIWEGDINPIFRCLADNYRGQPAPQLHTAFFDIETDFDPDRGFSSTDDPFNAITAISIYLNWLNKLITLTIAPRTMSWKQAEKETNKFENTYLFATEREMLIEFLNLIDDVDLLSGWNSEGYDIPYLVNRVAKVLSKDDTRKLCFWNQFPKKREFERYGSKHITFDLIGRLHIDYMQLYRKYTYEERHSYSLNAIAEFELEDSKVQYEGTLDQLYNQDFYTFLDYNRQDVILLTKLDQKLKFIDLANELAHDVCVLIQTTMGAVAVTDQAIINRAHDLGLIAPARPKKHNEGELPAAGAYVAYPKKGMAEWIGIIDINSLYPNAIRALNMSPETIVGQLRPTLTNESIRLKMDDNESFAAAWEGEFGTKEYQAVMKQDRYTTVVIDWASSNNSDTITAAQAWQLIFNGDQPWCLTANGTIFTYAKEGIIPGLLASWYADRKLLQKQKKEATTKENIVYYDRLQLVKKIQMNSAYGAILNVGSRFNDIRIGQSTTLSGRVIAQHMNAFTNECITGVYQHDGDAIKYADTDSSQFSAWDTLKPMVEAKQIEWDENTCIELYDNIAAQVNESFPTFMEKAFHCSQKLGQLIQCGREVVARRGLYITKKRYAMLVIDKDGTRLNKLSPEAARKIGAIPNIGAVKAMGVDLKRADTPKIVQNFLNDVLLDLLVGHEASVIIDKIIEFKERFKSLPAWEKGSPKRVNNLTSYTAKEKIAGKAALPGHVRAALNWNTLRGVYNDRHSLQIVDGMKVIVCKLKNNPIGYTSVAYPTDQAHLPNWFRELPFDQDTMESTVVDQKIENLFSTLDNWKKIQSSTQLSEDHFSSLFDCSN